MFHLQFMEKLSSVVYTATREKRLFQINLPRSMDMVIASENVEKYNSNPNAINNSQKKFKGHTNKNESRFKQL